MTEKFAPRHRAARRPATPFADLNTAANRRKAAAVAATGLGFAFVVSSQAVAADGATGTKGADVARLAAEAKTALKANPQVAVAKDAKWNTAKKNTVEVEGAVRVDAAVAQTTVDTQDAHNNVAAAPAAPAQAAPAAPSASGNSIVDTALRYTGVPYVWGGSTPAGFDCSGFTQYVFAQNGIHLPHSAAGQGAMGTYVPLSEAQPGDLLYWPQGHVGIYVGNGQMIDSSTPGTPVRVNGIWGYPQARRF